MRNLSLRSRLLMGVALVLVVQAVGAAVVVSIASDQLLDQIDDRLAAVVSSEPGVEPDLAQLERLGDLHQAVLASDGSLSTLNAVVSRGQAMPPPVVDPSVIEASSGRPVTVEAVRGELEYRLLAVELGGDERLILASPLQSYEWALNRVTTLVVVTALVVALALAAMTWWVIRLGIAPVKRMTAAAESIAAEDLSERVGEQHPGTEAGQLGAALNTMMGRIEASFDERTQAEQRLRQFIADASHELRTPVATIRGYSELYEAGGLTGEGELDDAMRRTNQESRRMSRLIADMLSLAKLDRGPTLRVSQFDLGALVQEVVADAKVANEGRRIEARVVSPEALVRGDEDLLRQAVTNLLSNAIVHTGLESTATVSVETSGGSGDERLITVTVADDGEGIPEEAVGRVTERFFRVDPSRSRHRGGSGLGLAIVDGIVAAHKGRLGVTSSPGEGTSVSFTLPSGAELDGSQPTLS